MRVRGYTCLYSLCGYARVEYPGGLIAFLRADLGCRTTVLHHASKAGWSEGLEMIIQLAGANYGVLMLERDSAGQRPVDVAGSVPVGARLGELTLHATHAEEKRTKEEEKNAAALQSLIVFGVVAVALAWFVMAATSSR